MNLFNHRDAFLYNILSYFLITVLRTSRCGDTTALLMQSVFMVRGMLVLDVVGVDRLLCEDVRVVPSANTMDVVVTTS